MQSRLIIGFFWIKDDTRDIWGLVHDGDLNYSKANIKKEGEYFEIEYPTFSLENVRIKGTLGEAISKAENDVLSRLGVIQKVEKWKNKRRI